MDSWVQSWRPRANVFFAIFPLHLSMPAMKKWCQVAHEVLRLSRKIKPQNLFSGNQRPDLLTTRWTCLLHCACHSIFWLGNLLGASVHFFDISNLHKPSKSAPDPSVFLHFWLGNVLCTTRACNFLSLSSGQLAPHPPLQRASFRPSGATNHWKNSMFSQHSSFSHIWIFFLLRLFLFLFSFFFSSLLFSDSSRLCFQLSILSEVWLLNFLWHIYI